MSIFSFTCNAFGKPKCTCPDDRQKQQETEGIDWRSAYDTTRAAVFVTGGLSCSVTLSGGLADECVFVVVPPACQIAVVFAKYQDSEAVNLLVSI